MIEICPRGLIGQGAPLLRERLRVRVAPGVFIGYVLISKDPSSPCEKSCHVTHRRLQQFTDASDDGDEEYANGGDESTGDGANGGDGASDGDE